MKNKESKDRQELFEGDIGILLIDFKYSGVPFDVTKQKILY